MGAMISRFVKVDDRYINLGAVKYAEVLFGGDVLIFTGTQNKAGEDIASVQLSGEDARKFIAFLDKYSDDLAAQSEDDIKQILDGAWQAIQGIIGGALDLINGIVQTALKLLKAE